MLDLRTADVKILRALLESEGTSSANLVMLYLSQIRKYDGYFRAVLFTAPEKDLVEHAKVLDEERAQGKVRGPLHGIPILLKDNIATHPSLGMPTSAGNTALLKSRTSRNARLVDDLIAAGMLIIGKTNLSELSSTKDPNMPSGWSAVGGQTQSAYVRGGLQEEDSRDGHSSPSGSSSGSAVGVSAGFAPLAIGTETDGSIMFPSGRAALYSMKPTPGLVSLDGIVPVSHTFDSAGPMAKSPYDLALLLDVLVDRNNDGDSYTKAPSGSWSDISIGTLDPEKWLLPPSMLKSVEEATVQINKEIREAYSKLESLVKSVKHNVELPTPDRFVLNGKDSEVMVQRTYTHAFPAFPILTPVVSDFPTDLKRYLEGLDSTPIQSLDDLIKWNSDHADEELPPCAPTQNSLLQARDLRLSKQEYAAHLQHCRSTARDHGVEKVFADHGADIILGPSDSALPLIATCGGYPVVSLPLGYLGYNGRPFGLMALGPRHSETLLFKVASAWEATFGPRQPPDLKFARRI
ncbi:amidase signature domain-containing protein [Massariosphaeria phaeospora]|uniref:Amidase signature domain-containing protein n=1 Tax=Massariosphaeria phaeospora TaxID=100035 RepID=A0A7C8IFV2_9PLEO|nr:amidase signature domain-containing protein [Massariosphaeria phaeospora]